MPGSHNQLDSSDSIQQKLTGAVGERPLGEFAQHLRELGVELRAKDDKLFLNAPAGVMTSALQTEVRNRKAELLKLLHAENMHGEDRYAPLTFAQQRLWLVDRFAPETAAYNIPQSWMIEDSIDLEAFKRALDRLAERHQTLRTRIELRNGEPVQVVMRRATIPVLFTDLTSNAEGEDIETHVRERLQLEGNEPFVLGHAPLIRFHIFWLSPSRSLVSYQVHHIVADQWSLDVLKRDLAALYLEEISGVETQLPGLAFQYGDVAKRERSPAVSQLHAGQLEYWRGRLNEMPTLLELPFSKVRPNEQSYAGATLALTLDEKLTNELRKLAANRQTTLYLLMLTTFATLLHRYTGIDNLCVGTPITGRKAREEEDLIGLFVNMLPLRCRVISEESFHQLLEQMSRNVLMDFEHGDIPFQRLVMELHPQRSPAYSPLFQVMFALNPKGTNDGQEAETFLGVAKFDLTLQIAERAQTLDVYLEYRTDLFTQADMEQFGRHFVRLAESIVEEPDAPVGSLTLLTHNDVEGFRKWNSTEFDFDRTATLADLFDRQVTMSPDAAALRCGVLTYTYRELQEQVDYLAAMLGVNGARPGVFVALCLDRSADLIVSMLAVLKSGAAYLPLDPKYPEERLIYMLADSGAQLLITQRDDFSAKVAADRPGLNVLYAREVLLALDGGFGTGNATHESHAGPEDAAYLIYTSGSTGKPKGVVVEHRNATALIAWAKSYFDPDSLHGVLASTSVCFDLSIFEIFLPLSTGNAIILVDDVLELPRSPLAEGVTLVNTVPSAMQTLLQAGLPANVRTVCMAGEVLPTELVDRVYAAGVKEVFDLYGPTETTTYSTCGLRKRGAAATIGWPIGNTRIYLLDDKLSQVPLGALGEIFIGGEGVTRGYLNRPELTAERFVYATEIEAGRLYRTGDMARQLQDGSLVFLGRRDQQVKLRGHRIELGEIEAVLRDVSGVSQVAVVVQKRDAGEALVAFIEEEGKRPIDVKSCAEALRRRLPEFMIPSAIVPIAAMPHTLNGKIDRKALHLMKKPFIGRQAELDSQDHAPRDLLEQWVANIWAHRLRTKRVVRDAHFFEELGGHSLVAFEIFTEIEMRLGVAMMLATLFQAPTVALLAVAIRRHGWRDLKHIRQLAVARGQSTGDRVTYVIGQVSDASLDALRLTSERVMVIETEKGRGLVDDLDLAVAEIVAFEAANPALVLNATHADEVAAARLKSSLAKAGFADVCLQFR